MPYPNYERWKTTPISDVSFLSVVIPIHNQVLVTAPPTGAIASHVSDLGARQTRAQGCKTWCRMG
jgi:hypothetical protein